MKPLLPTKHLTLLLVCMAVTFATKAQLSFAPQVTYPTDTVPYGVAIGDFNGDGKQDLAVANEEGTVSILATEMALSNRRLHMPQAAIPNP